MIEDVSVGKTLWCKLNNTSWNSMFHQSDVVNAQVQLVLLFERNVGEEWRKWDQDEGKPARI